MTAKLHGAQVALNLPSNANKLVARAQSFVERMTESSWFPDPMPPLARITSAITTLHDAQVASLSGKRGLKQVRTDAQKKLVALLKLLKAYVQSVADDNPENAASIILSAGMDVVARGDKPKEDFVVKQGRLLGQVLIILRAVAKLANYAFQMSSDGGKTWIDLPKKNQAKTTVSNLVPGTTYLFRYRVATRRAPVSDWSTPYAFIVK